MQQKDYKEFSIAEIKPKTNESSALAQNYLIKNATHDTFFKVSTVNCTTDKMLCSDNHEKEFFDQLFSEFFALMFIILDSFDFSKPFV